MSVTLPNTRNVVIMALGFGTNTQVVVPGTYVYTPACRSRLLPVGTDTLIGSLHADNTAGYTARPGARPSGRDQGDADH